MVVEPALPHGHHFGLVEHLRRCRPRLRLRRGGADRRWPTRSRGLEPPEWPRGSARRRCRPRRAARPRPPPPRRPPRSASGPGTRWQWLSVQRTVGPLSSRAGGRARHPSRRRDRRDSRPTPRRRAAAGRRARPTDRCAARARRSRPVSQEWPGWRRSATPRAASPSTASSAGPGSIFHGSLVSRWALASRINRHVASSARDGCTSSHADGSRVVDLASDRRERAVRIRCGTDAVALLRDHRGDA